MGKRLLKDELIYRYTKGDLKVYFDKYLESNDFIEIYYDTKWLFKFRCKYCGELYSRPIAKLKRFYQCANLGCKVRRNQQTKLLNYGDPLYNNSNKMMETKLNLYGDTFGSRDKIQSTKSKKDYSESYIKMVDTKRKKYGTTMCSNIEAEKDSWRNSMQSKHSTMSEWEQEAFNKLTSKYDVVVFNYYDKDRYPYLCDFYIGDLDMFIELNYHWCHGGEPYTGTKKQLDLVDKWKEKGWYGNIKIWTVKDVQKRSYAKAYNLNYKEFFNKESFNKWYDSI